MSASVDSLRSPEKGRTPTPVSGTTVEQLPDDLLVEIFSRVNAKSLSRFKCVSNHWLSLIDHPDHRKKLLQTLTGFFSNSSTYDDGGVQRHVHFTSVLGRRRDTPFSFLSNNPRFTLLDCCNGLFLGCWWDECRKPGYFIFNPTTEKWAAFQRSPPSSVISSRLCFDPAVSSCFHVFEPVYEEEDDDDDEWESDESDGPRLLGVAVYSSETGEWVYKEKKWSEHISFYQPKTVFINGYVHFLADGHEESDCLAVVDTKGETWINFPVPGGLYEGFIQQSQGRLNYANFRRDEDGVALRLVVYVLEDYESKEWILMHNIETSYLFGGIDVQRKGDFDWVAIHPDCNLLFFIAWRDKTLMCYNMDRRKVKVISNIQEGESQYLPYVPLYAELQSLHI